MTSITRFALQHRRLVALAWLALTVAGVLTVSSTTSRLSHGFNTPGTPGYEANIHLWKRFGIDGNEQPSIAVLTLPAGQTMRTAAGRAAAARTFAAARLERDRDRPDPDGNFPLMLAAIALITFLLLARSFRSVTLALKAVDEESEGRAE